MPMDDMMQAAIQRPILGNANMPAMPMNDMLRMYQFLQGQSDMGRAQQASGGLGNQMLQQQANQQRQQSGENLQNYLKIGQVFPTAAPPPSMQQDVGNLFATQQQGMMGAMGGPKAPAASWMPQVSPWQSEVEATKAKLKAYMTPETGTPTPDGTATPGGWPGMSKEDAQFYTGIKRRPGSLTDNQTATAQKAVDNTVSMITNKQFLDSDGSAQPMNDRQHAEAIITALGKVNINDPKIQAALDKAWGDGAVSKSVKSQKDKVSGKKAIPAGRIRVKEKLSGLYGTIDKDEFDPSLYEEAQ